MRELGIYKPNNKETGAAIQFKPALRGKGQEPAVFVEAAKQNGPKPQAGKSGGCFAWPDKVSLMLNIHELGELVAYIRGTRKDDIDFFHTRESDDGKRTATFRFKHGQNGSYAVQVTNKVGSNDAEQVGLYITAGEGMNLLILAESVVREYFMGGQDGPE